MAYARLVLVVVTLAGCTAYISPDAIHDEHDELPGATLDGWIEDNSTIRAVFRNDSGTFINTREGYHLGAWNLTISNEAGPIRYHARTACQDYFYDFLPNGDEQIFRFTWNQRIYEAAQDCRDGQIPANEPAPAGNYTATLSFDVVGLPPDAFRVELPIVVQP